MSLSGSRAYDRWLEKHKGRKSPQQQKNDSRKRKANQVRLKQLKRAKKGPNRGKRTIELCYFWSKILHRPKWIKQWINTTSENRRRDIKLRTHKHNQDSVINRLICYAGKDKWSKWQILTSEEKSEFRAKHRMESRQSFNKKKYKLDVTNEKCISCLVSAEIRHHIVMLNNGGTNKVLNIAPLCQKCHSKVHPWMKY